MTTKTITYPSGAIYTGQVIDDDVWHGRGKIQQFEDGKLSEEYEGYFNHDKRHGIGKLTTITDIINIYDGEWENDIQNGKGHSQDIKDGVVIVEYTGEMLNDMRDGQGTYHTRRPDGSIKMIYSGRWVRNLPTRGKFQYFDEDGIIEEYNGPVHNNKRYSRGQLIKYQNGKPYYMYEGEWSNSFKHGAGVKTFTTGLKCNGIWDKGQLVSGELLYKDVVIKCTWKHGYIDTVESVTNPRNIVVDLELFVQDEIFNKRSDVNIHTFDMYALLGFLHTEDHITRFLKDIDDRKSSARIVAICHAAIMEGFPLSVFKLQRVSQVENSICSYNILQETLNLLQLQRIQDDDKYIQQIELFFNEGIRQRCTSKPDTPERIKFLEMCKTMKKIPNRTFSFQQPILNKIFTVDEEDINLLLVYNDRGEYINLFTPDRSSITLQNLLKRIPNCSNCILIDKSCSSSNELIVQKQIQYMGGKKNKQKTKRKTKRKNKK